ncbi:HesA/MoeB/ThiF family protein [Robiginitalea sp. SC105]|uniref:HesA/MoeB/ThiF family protein n=1 Tax=Robiginitalea sp. SC105 TaxID=2762332 RepID=UPI00163A7A2D|nr:HesA/MoeB/ThiF family protein [Robiginitalea sp. SC105]MBC2840562.1 HesA/MoeB/ThiF family protein [Robiginitalea sp. SC105]
MTAGRYDRQIRLEGFGPGGQEALYGSAVLIVGAGGLGVPAAQYLNAMGVGRLGLVDGDIVETSNLHRQPAYGPSQVGKSKVLQLAAWLQKANPETRLETHDTYLNTHNALELIKQYDLVVDATDNLPTRYLIDDACLMLDKPWVYGALHGYEGQVSVFNYKGGPTYRCLFPEPPPSGEIPDCDTLGTLGVLPGLIGNMQALEATKVLSGTEGVCSGRLIMYDARQQLIHQMAFKRDPERQVPDQLAPTYQLSCRDEADALNANDYNRLRREQVPHELIDVREPDEFGGGHLPGARNIPLGQLGSASLESEDNLPVYLICETGPRSRKACVQLQSRFPGRAFFWVSGGMRQFKVEIL